MTEQFSAPRKLPRLNSEPNGGSYDKEYDGGYGSSKVGAGSKGLGRNGGFGRRGDTSPEQPSRERSRDSPVYTKYSRGDLREERDLRRGGQQYTRKEIRDTGDRERDRSPRETKNNYSNYERKEKEKRAEIEARAAMERRDRGLDSGRGGGGLERRVNSHLNHSVTGGNSGPGGGQASGFGDWTEHKSSNGKNYYYNIKTEVSQWEKPREWQEHERTAAAASRPGDPRGGSAGPRDPWAAGPRALLTAKLNCDTRTARSSSDKHPGEDGRPHRSSPSGLLPGSSRDGRGEARHRERKSDRAAPAPTAAASNSHEGGGPHLLSSNHSEDGRSSHSQEARGHSRDQEGSRGLSRDQEGGHRDSAPTPTQSSQRVSESTSSQGDATPTSEAENEGRGQEQGGAKETHPGGAVSLSAAIPRISSHPSGPLSVVTVPGPGPGAVHRLLAHLPSYPAGGPGLQSPGLYSPGQQEAAPAVLSPGLQAKLGGLHCLPPPLQLTPSLSRLYRENLIGHVLGWPAEQVERCCVRIGEETHQISSHGITKVSADLKMARSLVRLAEIQATLQEQRILFLRQQVADLDRVDRPVSREMSRDRDTLTREGLHHRDLAIRESLLQGRDPQAALREAAEEPRRPPAPRESPRPAPREVAQ